MAASEKSVLEFVTRLTYNIEGLSPALKLYLNQFLTFHFSKTFSLGVIQNIENKKASIAFRNDEEIRQATASFSDDELAWCVALLRLLRREAEASAEKKWLTQVDDLVNRLTQIFNLVDKEPAVEQQLLLIEQEVHDFQNRRVIRIPARIWPLVLDFILRCSTVLAFGGFQFDSSFLIVLNVFVVPAISMLIIYRASLIDGKYNMDLLQTHGGAHKFRIQFDISASQYTFLAFFLGTGVYVSYLLPGQPYVFVFIGLVLYFFFVLRVLPVGKIGEHTIERLTATSNAKEEYDYDRNDEQIVELETKMSSFTGRLEAYVLESALFGALTFSGFLQIMASDLVNFTDLENFAQYIFDTSAALLYFDKAALEVGLIGLSNKVSLLCLVSLESLICSGFFLAVIASRLRFSDVADRVTTSLNIARTYNDKEESLLSNPDALERDPGRLRELTLKVTEQLHLAAGIIDKVNPVMTYMRYFRNAGIIVFLAILVTSSLFITSILGLVFIAVVAATYIYFNYLSISLRVRAAFLSARIQFIRRAPLFFLGSTIPVVLSFILAGTEYWLLARELMAWGYFTIALYISIWLLLAAHVDEEFGDIEVKANIVRTGRWQTIKSVLALLILVYGIGVAFKQAHLHGADEIVLLTLVCLSILMYFVGYYLSKIRWLGIVCGLLLSLTGMGTLFKTLHLAGADKMLTVSTLGLIILTPVLIFKKRYFHRLFLRVSITITILAIIISSGMLYIVEVVATHRTTHIGPIMDVQASNLAESFERDPMQIPDGLRKCDWYLENYSSSGFTPILQNIARNYRVYARDQVALQKQNERIDTVSLTATRTLAVKAQKIYSMFDHRGEADYMGQTISEIDTLCTIARTNQFFDIRTPAVK